MHTWHWISSAISLICMILFAITGITLNHASFFESAAEETTVELTLPDTVLTPLNRYVADILELEQGEHTLPRDLVSYLNNNISGDLSLLESSVEWSESELYIQKPIPGGDSWMSVDLSNGELIYMYTDRGMISWLNDLHKGRNTGNVWSWFIDIFAGATLIFCLTGLVLLQLHSKNRPSTWYVTAIGIVIPGILAIFYI